LSTPAPFRSGSGCLSTLVLHWPAPTTFEWA
jgi:hypothetical protein